MIYNWLPHYQGRIEQSIHLFFETRYGTSDGVEKKFEEALRYAVEGGGKRLRTVLTLLAYEFLSGQDSESITKNVIGIELIHAYTLVHDDLPCMDNDILRRGKPTVWKEYGETMAVLVGDTLQTTGIEILSETNDIRIVREITRAMGDLGVVRGQVRDTFLRQDSLTLSELLRIHDEKTGVFIAASLVIGGYLAQVSEEKIAQLRAFGMLLGRAFQVRDDILDYEGNPDIVGKETGKDVALGKGIVALVGIEKSKAILSDLENDMQPFLDIFSDEKFHDVVDFVVHRVK